MPRRSRRRLVPISALIACVFPCAGASAAPLTRPDLPAPPVENSVASAAQAATLRALSERRERSRVQARREAAQEREVDSVVDAATAQIGDGYVFGGSGPDGFDCSGLTAYAFARADVALPHNSHGQAAMGRPVDRDDIRPGDLVIFSTAGAA